MQSHAPSSDIAMNGSALPVAVSHLGSCRRERRYAVGHKKRQNHLNNEPLSDFPCHDLVPVVHDRQYRSDHQGDARCPCSRLTLQRTLEEKDGPTLIPPSIGITRRRSLR